MESPQSEVGGGRSFASGPMREVTLFSTNDYLGLSSHLDVKRAVAQAAVDYGMGPRASQLVAGYTEFHQQLEAELSSLTGTEESLLFPTGD